MNDNTQKPVDLDELERLAKEAKKPGPWHLVGDGIYEGSHPQSHVIAWLDECDGYEGPFMAAAHPQAVLALIARLRAAEAEVAHLRALSGAVKEVYAVTCANPTCRTMFEVAFRPPSDLVLYCPKHVYRSGTVLDTYFHDLVEKAKALPDAMRVQPNIGDVPDDDEIAQAAHDAQTGKPCRTRGDDSYCLTHGQETTECEASASSAPSEQGVDLNPEQVDAAARAYAWHERRCRDGITDNDRMAATIIVGEALRSQRDPASVPTISEEEAAKGGSWVKADDVDRLVRELDVAWNGEKGAARQASLCDIVAQIVRWKHHSDGAKCDHEWKADMAGVDLKARTATQFFYRCAKCKATVEAPNPRFIPNDNDKDLTNAPGRIEPLLREKIARAVDDGQPEIAKDAVTQAVYLLREHGLTVVPASATPDAPKADERSLRYGDQARVVECIDHGKHNGMIGEFREWCRRDGLYLIAFEGDSCWAARCERVVTVTPVPASGGGVPADLCMRVARELWHVDAPDSEIDWEDASSRERYVCMAQAVLRALPVPMLTDVYDRVEAWLRQFLSRYEDDKRIPYYSDAASGLRIALQEIDRERYERENRASIPPHTTEETPHG